MSTFEDELLAARDDVGERLEEGFKISDGGVVGNGERQRPAAELYVNGDGGGIGSCIA